MISSVFFTSFSVLSRVVSKIVMKPQIVIVWGVLLLCLVPCLPAGAQNAAQKNENADASSMRDANKPDKETILQVLESYLAYEPEFSVFVAYSVLKADIDYSFPIITSAIVHLKSELPELNSPSFCDMVLKNQSEYKWRVHAHVISLDNSVPKFVYLSSAGKNCILPVFMEGSACPGIYFMYFDVPADIKLNSPGYMQLCIGGDTLTYLLHSYHAPSMLQLVLISLPSSPTFEDDSEMYRFYPKFEADRT